MKASRPKFANEAMRAATQFADNTHALNVAVVRSDMPVADLQVRVTKLGKEFTNLYHNYLRNADDKYREHIVQTSARVHETLFDLTNMVILR